jgi:hypothetical protein
MSQDEHAACAELMPGYQTDELSAEDRARVEAHVQECAECASQLQEIAPVELPEPPKRRLRDRLRNALALPRPDSPIRRGVLAAAAVILLGLVGYVLAEIDSDPVLAIDPGEVTVVSALPSPRVALQESSGSLSMYRGSIRPENVGVPVDEPMIFFPEAKESDHGESAEAEGFRPSKGDSASFLSYIRGEPGGFRSRAETGAYDVLGVGAGGGGGGRYGGRFGGQENLVARGGGTIGVPVFRPTEAAREFQRTSPQAEPAAASPSPAAKAPTAPAQEEMPRSSRKLIRSGEMEFEIDSFDSSVTTLTKIAVEEQGFIATVNSEKLQNGKVRGVVVVRVPPEHLDTLLLKLRALGDLKSQRIGSEDVTKTYLDLESRLRAAKTMEERLLAIIKDGKGQIKDLLQAEKELGEWRTRIETMMGEINYYNNLIAHSTLTISLYEREIRAPFALVETERVDFGLEVDDVEKAYADALAAIAEAKGRVERSDLKQSGQGQFNAVLQFSVAPTRAGALRDLLKQLGAMARLDISRSQEAQGGTGRPQDAKLQQNDTLFLVSIYNLTTVAPRETVQVSLACTDPEKSHQAVLDRVEKAGGRILSSSLNRQKAELGTGHLTFQVKAADADALLQDIRAAGEVLKLDITETQDFANATRTKRGFQVSFLGLGTVQPREISTIVLASKDVAAGYRLLAAAARTAGAQILTAGLNENDRKNMTAALSLDIRRESEGAIADAAAKAGDVYTRNSMRAPDAENITDSKTRLHFRFFDASNIPPRETVKIALEVGDVEAATRAVEAEYRGRLVDAWQTRDAGGRRESVLTVDLPLKDAPAAVERLKALGAVLQHSSSKNADVPDNDLAIARLELTLSNEVLLGRDAGPLASLKRGLAISLQAASWALMLLMIGVCFVAPLLLVVWAALRLRKRFAARPADAPTPAA